MVELFNRLARQTSIQLQIEYPYQIEEEMTDYLQYLRDRFGMC